jgi:multiple sugar transport system ATP-binding protein
MVFQNYALYPHMNVRKNMAFGLSLNGMPAAEIDRRVRTRPKPCASPNFWIGSRASFPAGSGSAWPSAGRSPASRKLFLLDEPLSNLDASLRVTMRAELSALHDRLG